MLVDVHCHLQFKEFRDDTPDVVARAKKAGVKAIVVPGVEMKTNKRALALAEKYSICKPTLGLYPMRLLEKFDKENQEILDFIKKNKSKIISVGEVGLDFKYTSKPSELKRQEKWFVKIIKLANKIKKPLEIHSRKAEEKCVDLLIKHAKVPVLLHSFEGNRKLIEKSLAAGFYFSIPTSIVRSKRYKRLVKIAPLDRLLTETDSPYCAPDAPNRNEPYNIKIVIEKIAEIKNISRKEVEKQVWKNYKSLF